MFDKYREPTPEELGLPDDTQKLYMLEYACAAPRVAWAAYYAERSQNEFRAAEARGSLHARNRGAADPRKARRQVKRRRA